jgi:putative endonuclease
MTNERNTTLYTGVTNNIERRVFEHKHKMLGGFTSKYNISKLVYLETTNSIESAMNREKQIKSGSRKKKVELIEKLNKDWRDLSEIALTGSPRP